MKVDLVLDIELDDEEVVKRIAGRRICPQGHIYNIHSKPPAVHNICDIDQEPLIIRADQEESVIRERLEVYRKQTEPLVEFFKQDQRLVSIQGDQSIEAVQIAIQNILKQQWEILK